MYAVMSEKGCHLLGFGPNSTPVEPTITRSLIGTGNGSQERESHGGVCDKSFLMSRKNTTRRQARTYCSNQAKKSPSTNKLLAGPKSIKKGRKIVRDTRR